MDPSGQPARSAAQGETAALLDQGYLLLVHAGGVHLQPQPRRRHPAALRPAGSSVTDTRNLRSIFVLIRV